MELGRQYLGLKVGLTLPGNIRQGTGPDEMSEYQQKNLKRPNKIVTHRIENK